MITWTEQTWPIERVKGYQRNPRKITKEQFERLKSAIESVGFHHPIAVDIDGTIISGNQRYRALCELGHKEVRVSVPSRQLTDKEFRQIVVQGNVSNGIWDTEILSADNDIEELVAWGLSEDWLLGEQKKIEPDEKDDEAPPVPKQAFTKRGDIWLLGDHRLMCGDSTLKGDVDMLMNGEKADMVFTDPPYGVSYADKNKYLNTIAPGNRIQTEIKNDHMDLEETGAFVFEAFCRIKEILADRSSYYITAPQGGDLMMMMMMQKAGIPLRHCLIWVKNNHVLGRTDYNYKHEPILFGWDKVHDFYGNGQHKFSTWEIPKPQKNDLHPTMKPVELVVNALLNSTKEGMIVADIFGGSGTTMIAAEKTNRVCRMMELSENYCDVIVRRWQEHSGKIATRQRDGAPLPETQAV